LLVHCDTHVVERRSGSVLDDSFAIAGNVLDFEKRVSPLASVVGQANQVRFVLVQVPADRAKYLRLIQKVLRR
jgi:hypothetical protein